jgi:TRAP-type C4-dicarboxylate transport system permease large subunit
MAGDIPLEDVFRGVTYFLPAYIVCIIILMLIPEVVTFLPNLLR